MGVDPSESFYLQTDEPALSQQQFGRFPGHSTLDYKTRRYASRTSATLPPNPMAKMPSFFSYSPKTTSISYPWPSEVTGLERIALSSQGDLQRVLSAFFARPITIALVYSHTFVQSDPSLPLVPLNLPNPQLIASASSGQPLVQTRQVHLQCAGKIVCTATSTVRISSPHCAHLFLEEKYAIGQTFSQLQKLPAFELLAVGLGPVDGFTKEKPDFGPDSGPRGAQRLWRKYKLTVPDFECEILEVFPSRAMFLHADDWLVNNHEFEEEHVSRVRRLVPQLTTLLTGHSNIVWFLGIAFLLMLAFELSQFIGWRSACSSR